MSRTALVLLLSTALPALAEEPAAPPAEDGFSLMEEGAKLVMRGLMSEMDPAFDEMEQALREMQPMLQTLGPELAQLMAMMGDVANYHAPEMLPNGDILIRRKTPLLPEGLPVPGPNGEIDL